MLQVAWPERGKRADLSLLRVTQLVIYCELKYPVKEGEKLMPPTVSLY